MTMNNFDLLWEHLLMRKVTNAGGCKTTLSKEYPSIVFEGPREAIKSVFRSVCLFETKNNLTLLDEFEIAMDLENQYISFFHKPEYKH